MRRTMLVACLALLASPSFANVSVEIVDYPASVLRYSPILVTTRIVNAGSQPVLVPVSDRTDNRYFLEVGRTADSLTRAGAFDDTGATGDVAWLKPGEARLFQVDVGPMLPEPGIYVIRAGVSSSGTCSYRATGKEQFPLTLIEKRIGREVYECWQGREVSEIRTVEVHEPDAPIDRAALEFIRSSEFPVDCCLEERFNLRLKFGASALLERFPTSHYTFVGAFYAAQKSPAQLDQLVSLQPTNPLAPYARFSAALARLRTSTSTASLGQVESLDVAPALKSFLVQEVKLREVSAGESCGAPRTK